MKRPCRPPLLAVALLAAAGGLGCGGAVKTSVYLQVIAGAGATRPDHVRIDVSGAGAPDGGGAGGPTSDGGAASDGGALLQSATYPVAAAGDPLLGTLVIYPRAGDRTLHIAVTGLLGGATSATASADVAPESGRQISVTITLGGAAKGDGGAAEARADGPADARAAGDARGDGAVASCAGVAAGQDPNGACPDDGANSCGRDGTCDGQGGCRLHAAGTACGAPTCASATTEALAPACDGRGACVPAAPGHARVRAVRLLGRPVPHLVQRGRGLRRARDLLRAPLPLTRRRALSVPRPS